MVQGLNVANTQHNQNPLDMYVIYQQQFQQKQAIFLKQQEQLRKQLEYQQKLEQKITYQQ